MSDFVHLHCHTEYSLLDGAIRIKDLCAKAKDQGMNAAAITDHGNLFGALRFYIAAKECGIKPIIGCEVYTCPDHSDKSSDKANIRHHLVLLAKNRAGYHNLVKLVSHGHIHGFYRKPRVDLALLKEYSEDLICLSACLAGEVPKAYLQKGMDEALEIARAHAAVFPGRYFLEVQSNGLAEQSRANNGLFEISEKLGLPLVATNDCHYLNADDADAHDVLLCIQTQAKVADPERMRFETRELYYKSSEEMEKDFAHMPQAIANAGRIAEMIEDYDFDLKSSHFPLYELSEGVTLEDEFRPLSRRGLEKRLEKMPPDSDRDLYRQRLELELNVICDMGFPGYFLIVQDFINWAKDNDIPVGPGRGSAAGSLAAYALRITNLDPIPYNLLFERFLNAERVSLPDIDVDFCEAKRALVIDYMNRKYGAESVAQITTFGKMLAKAAVRDVGRALGMSYPDTDRIAKLIPNDPKMTVKRALELEPDLKALYAGDDSTRQLLDTAMRLEGLHRHASVHAAGLVVSDKAMVDYLPVYRGKGENDVVTQFDMKMVEKVGLVKFDFLGLRNMTVIDDTLRNIKAGGQEAPDMDALPLDDPATYRLYANGDTDGIFQVESSGMRGYLRQLKPTVFEDIIAMLALYRPGPLKSGMVTDFIRRKHGRLEVTYPLKELEECLKDTHGVIVYQEQVMQISQIVAGYTLGEADILRRAMGKKNAEAMAAERSKFVNGALERGVPEAKAVEIFDLMESFAEYGFNKSHSAAYALISYHTAWLKTHYPVEFMAALLSSEMGDQDKLLKYISACKDMGVKVLPPDIRDSQWKFTVKDGAVLFGLGAIKNVGEEAVRELVLAREKDGPFSSLLDLCCRVPLRKMTKRVLESLIKSGACDSFGVSRAGLLTALDAVAARAQRKNREKESGQMSLLAMMPEEAAPRHPGIGYDCPESGMPEWEHDIFSRSEKEALGFYFTSHPLQPYRREMARLGLVPLEDLRELPPGASFKSAVLINVEKLLFAKRDNRRWALLSVEDLTASGTAFCYADAYEKFRELLLPDTPLLLEGRVNRNNDDDDGPLEEGEEAPPREIKCIVDKLRPLDEACADCIEPYRIDLRHDDEACTRLADLDNVLEQHQGPAPVHITLNLGETWCRLELGARKVTPGPALDQAVSLWAGR
ncbi:DNA polymerase III subunit alpha [Desulfovibrio sp. OttesenSCG-928-G11]|nr:DNA polymerase III subunit alpha [Desulfovibrio sp. OttesenSCG-928-G11]